MLINSWCLVESIALSISEYNKKLPKENKDKMIDNNLIEYSEDASSANVPEEVLSKLEELKVSLTLRDIEEENIQDITDELSQMLNVMKLRLFSFSLLTEQNQYLNLDMSFLEHLNADIRNILIKHVDLSKEKPSRFKRFGNLVYLDLENCNISDPRIISEVEPEEFISLNKNEIAPEYYKDALKIIQKLNGRIDFSDEELRKISLIYYIRQVELSDYLRLKEIIDFDSIPDLTIRMEKESYLDNINKEQVVNFLNGKTNITLKVVYSNLSKLDSDGILKVPIKVIIKNASELSVEELKKHQSVVSVTILDNKMQGIEQQEPYSVEEYEKVRSKIDKILSQIKLPDEADPNKEKKIFAQIYKILGKTINYDYNAISEEEKSNKRLKTTCRNLIGGLLENKCVCAGYADILKNVLACAGIYSEYVEGIQATLNIKDPDGHAWNLVNLDGKNYWTDLTWDANNIKANRYPLRYCLKSTKDFKHGIFETRVEDEFEDPCLESISDEEQYNLFTGEKLHKTFEENKNIGYLSSCIMDIADSGLTSVKITKGSDLLSVQSIEEKREEVDGRG